MSGTIIFNIWTTVSRDHLYTVQTINFMLVRFHIEIHTFI